MKNKKLIAYFMSIIISTSVISGLNQEQVRAEEEDKYQIQQLSTEYTYNNLTYFKNCDNEIEITGYVGEPTEVVIPERINGYKVTTIAYEAFARCASLKKVYINDSVTKICDGAFYGCYNLAELRLSNNINRIGRYTFNGTSISDLQIPSSVKYIEDGAFGSCYELEKVEIPEGVLTIGRSFEDCYYLKEVTIAKSVRWIDDYAFTSYRDITINGYSGGPAEEFANNRGYKFVSLGEYDIVDEDFSLNYKIKDDRTIEITGYEGVAVDVVIPSTIDGIKVTSIANEVFKSCKTLRSIELPETLITIGYDTFNSCDNLSSVKFPKSMESIKDGAFYNCRKLINIELPNGITKINRYSFYGCGFEELILPNSVTEIDEAAFQESSLQRLRVTNNLKKIHEYAFGTYNYGNSLKIIGYVGCYAEKYCNENIIKYNFVAINEQALKMKSCSITPSDEIQVNTVVTLDTLVEGGTGDIEYRYTILDSNNEEVLNSDYCTESTIEWKPSDVGEYTVNFEAKDDLGTVVSEKKNINVIKKVEEMKIVDYETDVASPQLFGNSIKLNTIATGGEGTLNFRFVVMKNGKITYARDYSSINTATWIPTEVGTYKLYFKVKDESGKEIQKSMNYTITSDLKVTSSKTSIANPQNIGTAINLSMESAGGFGSHKYRFVVMKDGKITYTRDYSSINTATWIPTEVGTYTLYFKVKDESGKETQKSIFYKITSKLKVTSYKTSLKSPQKLGTEIELGMSSVGGFGSHKYRFVAMKDGKVTYARDYSSINTSTWIPTETGTYILYFKVKDELGKETQKSVQYIIK